MAEATSQEQRAQDIEIEIETLDDKSKVVEVAPEEPPKKEPVKRKPAVDPDEGLALLQQQLENERRQTETERQLRLVAEASARDASESEVRARTEAQASQLDLIKNAHASLSTAQSSLKSRYADALTAQDFTVAADIQLEMSTNAARLSTLEQAKINLEKAPKPQPRPISDPVERVASQLSPQSAAWVRAHPEFARDDKKYRRMIAAHELAITDGAHEDTPEYFKHIEETLKVSQPAPVEDPMKEAAKPTRRAAPAAAPVTRSGNGAGPRTDTVTLTPEEVEMAELSGLKPEEYALQKVRIARDKAAGRLN